MPELLDRNPAAGPKLMPLITTRWWCPADQQWCSYRGPCIDGADHTFSQIRWRDLTPRGKAEPTPCSHARWIAMKDGVFPFVYH